MQWTDLKPHFSNYDKRQPFPRIQKPHPVGGFCLEQDRTFSDSQKYLSYLRLPQPGTFDFDLNVGYESYVPGPKEEHMNSFLKFFRKNQNGMTFLDPADFVCYRGLLTQIFITPYFPRDSWSVLATRFKGTIYLCNYVSPAKMLEYEARDSEYLLRCSYYGHNFERFVLTGDKTAKVIPNPPSGPLRNIEEFNLVLRTKLEGLNILFAAEVDGVEGDGESHLDRMEFVEVKTRMADTTDRQYNNYLKFKLPKWWCQSFLVGVEKIFCGFRTKEGHVKEIEKVQVRDIPKMCHEHWSPNVMVRFGADFLSMVHDLMVNATVDCPYTVFKFDYDSNLSWNVGYQVFIDKNEFSFLPESHVQLMASDKGSKVGEVE